MADEDRYRADREADGKFYVFDTHLGGMQCSAGFDTIGEAIVEQDHLNAHPLQPLQRFTIEVGTPPAALDVFIRNLYEDELLMRALVEHAAVAAVSEAVSFDAIYPPSRRTTP